MASTGRVITAAASLLVIVTGAAGLSDVALMKIAGIGMALAIVLDATVVRMLLVPALVTLIGPANWWMPGQSSRRRTKCCTPTNPSPASVRVCTPTRR